MAQCSQKITILLATTKPRLIHQISRLRSVFHNSREPSNKLQGVSFFFLSCCQFPWFEIPLWHFILNYFHFFVCMFLTMFKQYAHESCVFLLIIKGFLINLLIKTCWCCLHDKTGLHSAYSSFISLDIYKAVYFMPQCSIEHTMQIEK